MIFQSLLSSNTITNISLKLAIPFAIFALALTGGLAIACFVKAYGITFLGLHRSTNAKHAKEVNNLMRLGMLFMVGVVLSLMLFAPAYIHLFDKALIGLGSVGAYDAIFPEGVWHLHSVAINGGVVSPLILLISLLGVTGLLIWSYRVLGIKERFYRTWACGYHTGARTQYSATGFAGPIRRFFTWLYRPDEHLDKDGSQKSYEVHVKPLFERSLYEGAVKIANWLSYWVYRLAHFEQTRYAGMIFNLMLLILFSYRIVANEFSWATFALESVVMIISIKILIIGEKR